MITLVGTKHDDPNLQERVEEAVEFFNADFYGVEGLSEQGSREVRDDVHDEFMANLEERDVPEHKKVAMSLMVKDEDEIMEYLEEKAGDIDPGMRQLVEEQIRGLDLGENLPGRYGEAQIIEAVVPQEDILYLDDQDYYQGSREMEADVEAEEQIVSVEPEDLMKDPTLDDFGRYLAKYSDDEEINDIGYDVLADREVDVVERIISHAERKMDRVPRGVRKKRREQLRDNLEQLGIGYGFMQDSFVSYNENDTRQHEREEGWVQKIEEMAEPGADMLIFTGANHSARPNGFADKLRDAGYDVERYVANDLHNTF